MQPFISAFDAAHQWIFENIAQPMLFHLGMSNYIEEAYNGTMWLLIGLLLRIPLVKFNKWYVAKVEGTKVIS